jgi:hypothetical protein
MRRANPTALDASVERPARSTDSLYATMYVDVGLPNPRASR